MEKTQAPGLTWRNGKPIWRASRAAMKAGFPSAWVNLNYSRMTRQRSLRGVIG